MHYATWNCLEKTFTTCMELGARLDIKARGEYLPLHNACQFGSYSMVKTIVDKEPQQVNSKTAIGETPLHFCAWSSK